MFKMSLIIYNNQVCSTNSRTKTKGSLIGSRELKAIKNAFMYLFTEKIFFGIGSVILLCHYALLYLVRC